MTTRQVHIYTFTCDFCKAEHTGPERPQGWGRREDICYGSDHYYKDGYGCTKDACPKCMKGKEPAKFKATTVGELEKAMMYPSEAHIS